MLIRSEMRLYEITWATPPVACLPTCVPAIFLRSSKIKEVSRFMVFIHAFVTSHAVLERPSTLLHTPKLFSWRVVMLRDL